MNTLTFSPVRLKDNDFQPVVDFAYMGTLSLDLDDIVVQMKGHGLDPAEEIVDLMVEEYRRLLERQLPSVLKTRMDIWKNWKPG
jgi:hypothetical protein